MEIIHSLHKETKKNKLEVRSETSLFKSKLVFSFLFSLFSVLAIAQDSIVPQASISEKTSLEFQEYFFEAVTQKAIANYQKAIENLEEANQLIPDQFSVLYELSKNYYLLNKVAEADEYGRQALEKDPNNIWTLKLLVGIHQKAKNFDEAIKYQKFLAEKRPKEERELVYLHLKNRDIAAAKATIASLEKAKMLNPRLRQIKQNLSKRKKPKKKVKVTATKVEKGSLKQQFEKEKSFKTLQKLLAQYDTENNDELLNYSAKGMALFPAQPLVYLMNGKAQNKKGNHKKAVVSLQNGIDFIIDDAKMEQQFYSELVKAYKALGDSKNAKKYSKKLK